MKQEILKEDEVCKVELVSENPWQALRFTCRGTTSPKFRTCVKNILRLKDLSDDIVSTNKPFPTSLLYRKAPHGPPIINETTIASLP